MVVAVELIQLPGTSEEQLRVKSRQITYQRS